MANEKADSRKLIKLIILAELSCPGDAIKGTTTLTGTATTIVPVQTL